jgi:hypothetical protein
MLPRKRTRMGKLAQSLMREHLGRDPSDDTWSDNKLITIAQHGLQDPTRVDWMIAHWDDILRLAHRATRGGYVYVSNVLHLSNDEIERAVALLDQRQGTASQFMKDTFDAELEPLMQKIRQPE